MKETQSLVGCAHLCGSLSQVIKHQRANTPTRSGHSAPSQYWSSCRPGAGKTVALTMSLCVRWDRAARLERELQKGLSEQPRVHTTGPDGE